LYVLDLAFFFASRMSFWLICGMSLLILAVGWAYTQICRIYPDGGGVYTAAKSKSRTLAVIGALLLFADYTVTASLSSLDAFHYFGLGAVEAVQTEASAPPRLDPATQAHHGAAVAGPRLTLNGETAVNALTYEHGRGHRHGHQTQR